VAFSDDPAAPTQAADVIIASNGRM